MYNQADELYELSGHMREKNVLAVFGGEEQQKISMKTVKNSNKYKVIWLIRPIYSK